MNELIEHIKSIGQRLIIAQPREITVGNIVRRVLGVVREESEGDGEGNASNFSDPGGMEKQLGHNRHPSLTSHMTSILMGVSPGPAVLDEPTRHLIPGRQLTYTQAPQFNSMFSLLSHPSSTTHSPTATPPSTSHSSHHPHDIATFAVPRSTGPSRDLKPGIIEGIGEILEELYAVDSQIADISISHIHSNEIILTHGYSHTVHKFLLKAATKRTFTVILAEGYPNDHDATHSRVMGLNPDKGDHDEEEEKEQYKKTLCSAGITVILIPDSAVYALMSRVNKVILGTHCVLANGGLLASAGARTVARAAQEHSVPVLIVTGVYKLSPVYPFDWERLVELGEPWRVAPFEDEELAAQVNVLNPIFDYVPPDLVDLYVTNL